MTTLIENIRDFGLDYQADPNNDDESIWYYVREFLMEFSGKFKNWPLVPSDPEDEDMGWEKVDLENLAIISITDDTMEFFAGGDWQPIPTYIKLKYTEPFEFDCVETRPMNIKTEKFEGLSGEQLAEIFPELVTEEN